MSAVSSALTTVAGWLVEPAPGAIEPAAALAIADPGYPARPVVAVAGLRGRVGVTTLARAIGGLLATREPAGACVVTCAGGSGSIPLGLPAATRLGRRLAPVVGTRTRACGRLCLVEEAEPAALCAASRALAPVVLDVSDPAQAAAAASLADRVVLVAGPDAEPSLAAVVAESLAAVGPEPAIVVNRARGGVGKWEEERHLLVPESRLAAQFAAAGREPRGPFGEAVAGLTGLWVDGG